ncbi:uncharacterized protein LOC130627329 [Hydractinia symbiolongicarpus]|uniref:uncharacterized protein LOC130627329 n=1 Tax=Hydractinia symbiolongicarpus TaxID=13093 RepID=UPI00254D360A|nr:uncharacterized protein LOC130627329 [Hydractinia symbiolongicarpus]
MVIMLDYKQKVLSSVGCAVCSVAFLLIEVFSIAIGVAFKDDCPAENRLPGFLVIFGIVSVTRQFLPLYDPIKRLFEGFIVLWFILENSWLYHSFKPSLTNSSQTSHCNEILYFFTFWVICMTWLGIFVVIILPVCLLCGIIIRKVKNTSV